MPSTEPIDTSEIYLLAGDPAAVSRVDAGKLDHNIATIVAVLNALIVAVSAVERDDNTLVDAIVRTRNLHAEVLNLAGATGATGVAGPQGLPGGLAPSLIVSTGTVTLSSALHNGKTLVFTNAAGCTVTVPQDLPLDFSCVIVQRAAGQVFMQAGGAATVINRQAYTKTAAQWAVGSITVVENPGTAAIAVLAGDLVP